MFTSTSSPKAILDAAERLEVVDGEVLMVLVGEREHGDLDQVTEELRGLGIDFFGGLFPALVHEDEKHDQGALLVKLPAAAAPMLVTGLDQGTPSLVELGSTVATAAGPMSAVVFVDGLTSGIGRLLSELYGQVGTTMHFVGGGAGSLSLEQQPCIFTRAGVYQDAAVVTLLSQQSRVGVRHGWERLAGPVIATRTNGNVIHELNWRSAFDVYREAIEPHTQLELTKENLFRVSNAFPFGIFREGTEDVVRDPVSLGDDGSLICVGEVPENVVLHVLVGDAGTLVEAAGQAAEDCCTGPLERPTLAFIVDCVSRTLFLEDEFGAELAAVRAPLEELAPEMPLCGVLSLGEISSHGEGVLEFFNKTIVAAVLHD